MRFLGPVTCTHPDDAAPVALEVRALETLVQFPGGRPLSVLRQGPLEVERGRGGAGSARESTRVEEDEAIRQAFLAPANRECKVCVCVCVCVNLCCASVYFGKLHSVCVCVYVCVLICVCVIVYLVNCTVCLCVCVYL